MRVRASWLSRHARSLPLRVRAHAARRAPTDRPCVTALSSARSHVTTLARRARASRAFSAFRVRSHSVVAHRGATCSTLRSSSAAPWRLVSRSTRSTRRSGGGARVDRLRGAAARRARRRAHRDRRLTPVTTRCCTSVRCVVCWRMLPYLGIFVHIGIFVCVRDIHILIYIAFFTSAPVWVVPDFTAPRPARALCACCSARAAHSCALRAEPPRSPWSPRSSC